MTDWLIPPQKKLKTCGVDVGEVPHPDEELDLDIKSLYIETGLAKARRMNPLRRQEVW
jgi:hypothetical protein